MRIGLLSGLLLALAAQAQLIPAGTPVPVTTLPPVVFINGYQFEGCPSTFAALRHCRSGASKQRRSQPVLQHLQLVQHCHHRGSRCAFGTFLAGLQYTNGQPVETVDVVAHSMGGLVLRAYLSGKQATAGVFQPPASANVRKAVFLATPHFGTPDRIAAADFQQSIGMKWPVAASFCSISAPGTTPRTTCVEWMPSQPPQRRHRLADYFRIRRRRGAPYQRLAAILRGRPNARAAFIVMFRAAD